MRATSWLDKLAMLSFKRCNIVNNYEAGSTSARPADVRCVFVLARQASSSSQFYLCKRGITLVLFTRHFLCFYCTSFAVYLWSRVSEIN